MNYVCLTIGGFYVREMQDFVIAAAGGRLLDVRGKGPGEPTIFRRTELGDKVVTLQLVSTGAFLTGLPDGAAAWGPEGPESRWTEVWWPDDRISLHSVSRRFLCAERGGGDALVANRAEAGAWEKFFYEQPPAELLPTESPPKESTEGRTLGKRKRRNPLDPTGSVSDAATKKSVRNPLEP